MQSKQSMQLKLISIAMHVAILANLSGCRIFSGEPSNTRITEIPVPENREQNWRKNDELALARECPPIEAICTKSTTPVFCQVKTYKDKLLHTNEQLAVHADSSCAARTQIYKTACAAKMIPSQLGTMQCIPDGSSGNCPVSEEPCDSNVSHTICFADRYMNQIVKRTPGLFGRGINECDARQNLIQVTCRNNLDPELLTEISCLEDVTGGECLNLKHLCSDERKKTFCRVTLAGGNLPQPDITGEGESRCEAMMAIHREACSMQIKPSVLDEVVCVFDK
jgi:hypothetical protein